MVSTSFYLFFALKSVKCAEAEILLLLLIPTAFAQLRIPSHNKIKIICIEVMANVAGSENNVHSKFYL